MLLNSFRIYFGAKPFLYITDLNMIREVTVKQFDKFVDRTVRNFLCEGLNFTSNHKFIVIVCYCCDRYIGKIWWPSSIRTGSEVFWCLLIIGRRLEETQTLYFSSIQCSQDEIGEECTVFCAAQKVACSPNHGHFLMPL